MEFFFYHDIFGAGSKRELQKGLGVIYANYDKVNNLYFEVAIRNHKYSMNGKLH